jgi:alpha-maltose-1-phosphate synthase
MKILVLYEYPQTMGSMSTQGELLYRGLIEQGVQCERSHYQDRKREREWRYRSFRPDVVIGLGWWVDTPQIIREPQQYGLVPVPWLLADGWVANYHADLNSLPLVLTTSRWVAETYQRDGVDIKNFQTLHVGYDPALFFPRTKLDTGVQHVRAMFGVRDSELMIGTVGGDVTSKGAQEMLRALARVDGEFPHWKYVCKSTNSECARNHHEEELALIEELGIPKDKVVYIDDDFSRDFMPYFLNACDIYAAPSRIEGFGMVQVEAMACGTPVISIDAMGPKETIIHGEAGYLARVASEVKLTEEWVTPEMGFEESFQIKFVQPKTFAYRAHEGDLAEYTLRLLTDNELRDRVGRQAASHALANFHYGVLAKRCVDILRETFRMF